MTEIEELSRSYPEAERRSIQELLMMEDDYELARDSERSSDGYEDED